jgi:hypothetical protein
LPVVIAQLAIQFLGQLQSLEVSLIVISIEYCVYLFEGARLNLLVAVAALK